MHNRVGEIDPFPPILILLFVEKNICRFIFARPKNLTNIFNDVVVVVAKECLKIEYFVAEL